MKYCVALVSLVCVFALAAMEAEAMPPIQCNPRYVDEVSLRIRKVCNLINTLEEFNNAMEGYTNRQGLLAKLMHKSSYPQRTEPRDSYTDHDHYQHIMSFLEQQNKDELPNALNGVEGLPLLDSGVKRQDVDHVFLRFGKKRR